MTVVGAFFLLSPQFTFGRFHFSHSFYLHIWNTKFSGWIYYLKEIAMTVVKYKDTFFLESIQFHI